MARAKRPLLAPERHALILQHLRENDSASLATLTRLTGSSESTIRRDLLELSARSPNLRRTHGGVVSSRLESSTYEPPARVAAQLHAAAKQRIGAAAARMVREGQSVMFDSGSTVAEAARAVARRGLPITAITNDLAIAQILSASDSIAVIVSGGMVRPGSATLYGPPCEALLATVHFDLLFLGTHSVSESGLTESSLEIAQAKRRMIDAAKRVVLLADQSKFGGRSFAHICPLEDVDVLIADAAPPDALGERLQAAGVESRIAWTPAPLCQGNP